MRSKYQKQAGKSAYKDGGKKENSKRHWMQGPCGFNYPDLKHLNKDYSDEVEQY